MKSRINKQQGDLFGLPEIETLRREIQELDEAIAKALKSDNYNKAKALATKQEHLIQRLVNLSEDGNIS